MILVISKRSLNSAERSYRGDGTIPNSLPERAVDHSQPALITAPTERPGRSRLSKIPPDGRPASIVSSGSRCDPTRCLPLGARPAIFSRNLNPGKVNGLKPLNERAQAHDLRTDPRLAPAKVVKFGFVFGWQLTARAAGMSSETRPSKVSIAFLRSFERPRRARTGRTSLCAMWAESATTGILPCRI